MKCKKCGLSVIQVPDLSGMVWVHYRASKACRKAEPEGECGDDLQAELDRMERDEPVVKQASKGLDGVYEHLKGRLPPEQVAHIYDLERPFEQTLSDGDGDLG